MYAAFCCWAFVSYLLYEVRSQDAVSIAFSKNPVYQNDILTITCSSPHEFVMVTLHAINGTHNAGSLRCAEGMVNSTVGTGLFTNSSYVGCPHPTDFKRNVIVSMRASLMLELDYICEVRNNSFHDMNSSIARLAVRALPSVPKIVPSPLVFNYSGNESVSCESNHGKPSADITLTVRAITGQVTTTTGVEVVSWKVSKPRIWQNATVLCNVTNHISPNLTVEDRIIINYIIAPDKPIKELNNKTLNCSAAVTSHPDASYIWSIPSSEQKNDLRLNSSQLFVRPGLTGLFRCNATNVVTLRTVVVTYEVTNNSSSTHEKGENWFNHGFTTILIASISAVSAAIIIVVVVICILFKCGYFQNDRTSAKLGKSKVSLQDGRGEEIAMSDNIIYDGFTAQPLNDVQYTEHAGRQLSSKGEEIEMSDNLIYDGYAGQSSNDAQYTKRTGCQSSSKAKAKGTSGAR